MAVADTLAYYENATITAVKSLAALRSQIKINSGEKKIVKLVII
jgi:hypothetical protein